MFLGTFVRSDNSRIYQSGRATVRGGGEGLGDRDRDWSVRVFKTMDGP